MIVKPKLYFGTMDLPEVSPIELNETYFGVNMYGIGQYEINLINFIQGSHNNPVMEHI